MPFRWSWHDAGRSDVSRAHDDAAVHSRLVQTIPTYAPNTPLSHWTSMEDPSVELQPGTVLRAKEGDESDPWFYVRVTGPVGTGRDRLEYGLTSLFEFTEVVSAPARGEGGILATYEVMLSSEARALIEARRSAADAPAEPPETVVDAARRQLDAARAEDGR